MSSVYRDYGNTLSLYQRGYLGWMRTGDLDAKTYYEKLCDMVVYEYKTQGFCRLVDEIIEGKKDVEAISFHSMESAGDILRGNKKKEYVKYVPAPIQVPNGYLGTTRAVTWGEWTVYIQQYGGAMLYRYDERVHNTLQRLKTKGQESHQEVIKKCSQTDEKKEINIKDKESDAKSKAEKIVAKAREDASRIIEEARSEAERIRTEAYQGVTKNERGGESSILSAESIQEYLEKERELIRMTLGKEYEDALDESHAVLGTAERIHNEMCDQTNKLQASWVKALDQTVEELATIKEDFYKRIHNWQVGLYPHELKPLAERYIELYHIVNVDNIIAEELFRISVGNNANNGESEIAGDQSDNTESAIAKDGSQEILKKYNSSPVLEELEKLNRKLCIFLKKFEASLNSLDMYVYHPENGEVYDEVWHVIEDDSEFDYSKEYRVKRCVLPGVAKKVNDDGEDDVIIPATVEV